MVMQNIMVEGCSVIVAWEKRERWGTREREREGEGEGEDIPGACPTYYSFHHLSTIH
jgi:hypothetical protein